MPNKKNVLRPPVERPTFMQALHGCGEVVLRDQVRVAQYLPERNYTNGQWQAASDAGDDAEPWTTMLFW